MSKKQSDYTGHVRKYGFHPIAMQSHSSFKAVGDRVRFMTPIVGSFKGNRVKAFQSLRRLFPYSKLQMMVHRPRL